MTVAASVVASVQRRLSVWLSVIIMAVVMLAGGFAFTSAFCEAHELQDDALRQAGAMFDPGHLPAPGDPADTPKVSDTKVRAIVQVLPPADAVLAANLLVLTDGVQTVRLGKRDYRMWVRTLVNSQRAIVVQETAVWDETARDSALRTLMPLLILVPILLLAVAHVLRRMFTPIKWLVHEVDQRDERQLYATVPEAVSDEVHPFVAATNRLLTRV